jgi:hypothetical protein
MVPGPALNNSRNLLNIKILYLLGFSSYPESYPDFAKVGISNGCQTLQNRAFATAHTTHFLRYCFF